MSVIAMRVSSCTEHPNADSLKVYEFEAPGHEPVRVIANLENVYQCGDVVAVALIGSTLKDGLKIKKTRLRGVDSFGMSMGRVDSECGTDLSEEFCLPPEPEPEPGEGFPIGVVKWTSVELFHHVVANLKKMQEIDLEDGLEVRPMPKINYQAKIKLDGTNGGIHILPGGQVIAQSRSRLLTLDDDNIGFAKWVQENEDYFRALSAPLGGKHAILFGEWCGKGIQKRTAISKIPMRIFAVFAIQYGDHLEEDSTIEIEPTRIRALLPEHPEVFVLPWTGAPVSIDFGDKKQLEQIVDKLNAVVEEVEEKDPWVSEVFGVDGLGEGVVMYPIDDVTAEAPLDRGEMTWKMFKAKGEKHQVIKQKSAVQIDPMVVEGIQAFVELFVTPARLEQGVAEACQGLFEPRKMGDFLKWMGQDVKKESPVELEASGLEWKQVGKAVATKSRTWYLEQIQKIV